MQLGGHQRAAEERMAQSWKAARGLARINHASQSSFAKHEPQSTDFGNP